MLAAAPDDPLAFMQHTLPPDSGTALTTIYVSSYYPLAFLQHAHAQKAAGAKESFLWHPPKIFFLWRDFFYISWRRMRSRGCLETEVLAGLLLLHTCHHTAIHVLNTAICVSSYSYIRVLILLYVSSYSYLRVLILLHMCPQLQYVFPYYHFCPHSTMCPHTDMCVLILLHMCPHTTVHVSSFYYVSSYCCMCPHTTTCVLIQLYMCPHSTMCPHTAVCVLILLHMCPHTTVHVSLFYYVSS